MSVIKNTHTIVLAVFLIAVSSSAARSQSISTDMQRLPSGTAIDLIVQYKQKPNDADHSMAKSLGAKKGKDLALIKASGYRMTPAAAARLVRQNHNVKYISPDRAVQGVMNLAVPAVNADLAHNIGMTVQESELRL